MRTMIDHEIQWDWSRIDKSQSCAGCKERRLKVEMEETWEANNLRGEVQESWARSRCGSIGKAKNKRFRETQCSLRGEKAQILKCEEMSRKGLVDGLTAWEGNRQGEDLEWRIESSLQGKPDIAVCEYFAELQIRMRKAKV